MFTLPLILTFIQSAWTRNTLGGADSSKGNSEILGTLHETNDGPPKGVVLTSPDGYRFKMFDDEKVSGMRSTNEDYMYSGPTETESAESMAPSMESMNEADDPVNIDTGYPGQPLPYPLPALSCLLPWRREMDPACKGLTGWRYDRLPIPRPKGHGSHATKTKPAYRTTWTPPEDYVCMTKYGKTSSYCKLKYPGVILNEDYDDETDDLETSTPKDLGKVGKKDEIDIHDGKRDKEKPKPVIDTHDDDTIVDKEGLCLAAKKYKINLHGCESGSSESSMGLRTGMIDKTSPPVIDEDETKNNSMIAVMLHQVICSFLESVNMKLEACNKNSQPLYSGEIPLKQESFSMPEVSAVKNQDFSFGSNHGIVKSHIGKEVTLHCYVMDDRK